MYRSLTNRQARDYFHSLVQSNGLMGERWRDTEREREGKKEGERVCAYVCVCVCVYVYVCVPACVKEHERDPERAPNTVLAFHTPLCRNSTNLQKNTLWTELSACVVCSQLSLIRE